MLSSIGNSCYTLHEIEWCYSDMQNCFVQEAELPLREGVPDHLCWTIYVRPWKPYWGQHGVWRLATPVVALDASILLKVKSNQISCHQWCGLGSKYQVPMDQMPFSWSHKQPRYLFTMWLTLLIGFLPFRAYSVLSRCIRFSTQAYGQIVIIQNAPWPTYSIIFNYNSLKSL